MMTQPKEPIVIVSGIPRSGTSMMMKMLETGGMEVVSDHLRSADSDNPNGYYEYDRAKRIKDDNSWVAGTCGKVFKLVSSLLLYLPEEFEYRIVFMQRNLSEVIASQAKMLTRQGKKSAVNDQELKTIYTKHLGQINQYLAGKSNIRCIKINFIDCINSSEKITQQLCEFLGSDLKHSNMAEAIDSSLYRNRFV